MNLIQFKGNPCSSRVHGISCFSGPFLLFAGTVFCFFCKVSMQAGQPVYQALGILLTGMLTIQQIGSGLIESALSFSSLAAIDQERELRCGNDVSCHEKSPFHFIASSSARAANSGLLHLEWICVHRQHVYLPILRRRGAVEAIEASENHSRLPLLLCFKFVAMHPFSLTKINNNF